MRAELAAIGERVRAAEVRLSVHPAQYVVLNSEDEAVRRGAALDLELEAALLDAMGLGPEAVMILHVGAVGGDKAAAIERFVAGFERLGERARARLVIENDDARFGLGDVLGVAERTGLRIVWDALHHRCYDPDGIPPDEALRLALATWGDGDGVPKIHYSSPRTAVEERKRRKGRRVERQIVLPPLRAHADMIDPIGFEDFIRGPAATAGHDFDVMLEAKAKDLALLQLRRQRGERGFEWSEGRLGPVS
jgi:UV DNA damage endonuclease